MMKTKLENNVLTVTTGIKAEVAKKGIADLRTFDKNKEPKFFVKTGTVGEISDFGLTCNAEVDGELAIVLVEPIDTTVEDVKKKYGKKLVKAKAELEVIVTEATKAEEAVAEIFAQ